MKKFPSIKIQIGEIKSTMIEKSHNDIVAYIPFELSALPNMVCVVEKCGYPVESARINFEGDGVHWSVTKPGGDQAYAFIRKRIVLFMSLINDKPKRIIQMFKKGFIVLPIKSRLPRYTKLV